MAQPNPQKPGLQLIQAGIGSYQLVVIAFLASVITENADEEKITERTKAILAVHLYGQASKMDTISDLAKNICCPYRRQIPPQSFSLHFPAHTSRNEVLQGLYAVTDR